MGAGERLEGTWKVMRAWVQSRGRSPGPSRLRPRRHKPHHHPTHHLSPLPQVAGSSTTGVGSVRAALCRRRGGAGNWGAGSGKWGGPSPEVRAARAGPTRGCPQATSVEVGGSAGPSTSTPRREAGRVPTTASTGPRFLG